MNKLMVSVSLIVATASVSPVWAQNDSGAQPGGDSQQGGGGGRHGGRHHGPGGRESALRDILTADQQKQFDQINSDNRAAIQPLFQNLETLRSQQGAKANPALDQKIAEAQKALQAQRKSAHEKIQALLTPDQKAQLEKRRAERRAARQGGGDGGNAQGSDPDKD